MPGVFDLDAYLARIGLSGRPTVAEVHRAHITSIPFENLERKLVRERRGGYCFEQNLLLKAALEALGAEVEMVLARVRVGAEAGAIRPRSHLLLRVRADGLQWHADVGFGNGSLLEPLPWGAGEEHVQSGWRFRIVEEGPELVLQTLQAQRWVDVYAFLPQASPLVDLETSNWFTSTHPHSPFVTGLIVSTQSSEGTRTTLSDWSGLKLTQETPEGATATAVERDAVPELLAAHFGLEGWVMSEEGGLVASPASPAARSDSS